MLLFFPSSITNTGTGPRPSVPPQRRPGVGQKGADDIHTGVQVLAQAAEEPRHTHDEQELPRYLHQGVGADGAGHAGVGLGHG